MNQNNLFSSNFSSSNPFGMNMNNLNNTSNLDTPLLESYAKLEALKQHQAQMNNIGMQQQRQTVFNDIADELKGLTDDELNFIVNSTEYQSLNQKYQNEFSQFLINKFQNEYLQSGNSARTLEEILHIIKQKKEKYKEKFANDINEIKDQNKELLSKNSELANSNEELKAELQKIQAKLSLGDL